MTKDTQGFYLADKEKIDEIADIFKNIIASLRPEFYGKIARTSFIS